MGEEMLRKLGCRVVVCAALAPVAAAADCAIADFDGVAPSFSGAAPLPPAEALRPVTPECLRNLASPSQENCSDAEVAAYSAAVDAYVDALNAYVAEADTYARAAAEHANASIAHAERAQAHANAVFDFATCAAEALRAQQ